MAQGATASRRRWVVVAGLFLVAIAVVLVWPDGPRARSGRSSRSPRPGGTAADSDSSAKRPEGHEGNEEAGEEAASEAAPKPGKVELLLADHGADYVVTKLTVTPLPVEDGARPRTLSVRHDRARFELPPGDYELRWYVPGLGFAKENIHVAAAATVRLDLRDRRPEDYGFSHGSARIVALVRDADQWPAAGVQVGARAAGRDGRYQARRTMKNGLAYFLVPAGKVIVSCGSWSEEVITLPYNEYRVEIPGARSGEFGELLTSPSEVEARIRRQGEQTWLSRPARSAKGRLFPCLTPGTYELAVDGGSIEGSVRVEAGRRATFSFAQYGILFLRPRGEDPDLDLPAMLRYEVRGVSAGASYPEGYKIIWVTTTKSEIALRRLAPGAYRVRSLDARYGFSRTVDVAGGSVVRLDVVFAPAETTDDG